MKLLRNLLLSILLFGLILITGGFSYAKDYEYKNLDIQADVRIDGTIDVRETFTANFLERKHGIIRNIPLNYDVDGYKFHINIDRIVVDSHNYNVISNGDNIDIKIGDANKTVIGNQIYPISYSTYGLIRNFSGMGYAELYWNLVGYDFDTNIDSVKAEIRLPKKNFFSSGDFLISVDGNGSSIGSFEGKVDWRDGNKIVITYDKRLPAGKGITLAIKFPNDYFNFDHDKQESLIGFVGEKSDLSNMFSGGNGSFSKIMAIIIGVIVVACFIFKSLLTGISDIFTHHNGSYIHKSEIEDELNKEGPIVVRYGPPKGVNCAEAGMLYNCILEPTDLTSLLYKWAIEGLISIEMDNDTGFSTVRRFIMTKLKDIDDKRPQYEIDFFKALLPGDINSKKAISTTSEFDVVWSLKSLRSYGKLKGRIRIGGFDILKFDIANLTIGFLVALITFCIAFFEESDTKIALFIALLFGITSIFTSNSADHPTQKKLYLTQEGKILASEVIGYANFIKMCDENKLRLFLKQDPAFFDKTLPYAVAFGFETLFIRKITPILNELDMRLTRYEGNVNELDYISRVVRDMIRTQELRRAKERDSHSTYDSSSGFSSGSSFSFGGGGFSHGGGGGGGGSRSW